MGFMDYFSERHEPNPPLDEIVTSRGYVFEEHKVDTSDGYILTIHRIKNPLVSNGKAVLIQHGFASCSAHWLIGSEEEPLNNNTSGDDKPDDKQDGQQDEENVGTEGEEPKCTVSNNLAFALSKAGYDVWLGNFRGNMFSTGHKSLNCDEDKCFWDFSIDELVSSDLPAMIDYVLKTTDSRKLHAYIGVSQGSLSMMSLLSEKPEFSTKISKVILLAPVIRLSKIRGLLRILHKITYPLVSLMEFLITRSYMTGPFFGSRMQRVLFTGYRHAYYPQIILRYFLFSCFGYSWSNLDRGRLDLYNQYPLADSSLKNWCHYIQTSHFDEFRKYNYGPEKNEEVYGSPEPPLYDLSKVQHEDLTIVYSDNDYMISQEDMDFLSSIIKVREVYKIPDENFNHLDYHFGSTTGKMVNKKMLALLSQE